MREIKFRVWNPNANKFVAYAGVNEMPLHEAGALTLKVPVYEILQYTGLKDKNGVEIYEGDIVRLTDDWDNESVHKVEYCAEYDYPAFDVKPHIDAESNGLSHFMATGEIEVIGNIWEHEELLSDS